MSERLALFVSLRLAFHSAISNYWTSVVCLQSKNSNTLVAATQTRRKQMQESMSRAFRAQEERVQRERERARITMLPVLRMASIEAVPQVDRDEREDGN